MLSDAWIKLAFSKYSNDQDSYEAFHEEALKDERIKEYLADISDFHGFAVTNHRKPELPVHKLHFLLDIGIKPTVPEIQKAVEQIKAHRDENGVYLSVLNIPKHFGGTGENMFTWCLCDAPRLLEALIKCGEDYETVIEPGLKYLMSFCRDNGFPCKASETMGKFKGPGRKSDPCPYATLLMLKVIALVPSLHEAEQTKKAIDTLLNLWTNSREQFPFLFHMGTDFRKLKAPTNWYDIVSVADCLSWFEYAKDKTPFKEIVEIIKSKQNDEGLFTPESVYQKYKIWDFGQKKTPSLFLSLLCTGILDRVSSSDQ